MLTDAEFLRYGRQLMLPQVGEAGQARLKQGRVLIVGLGGLGSPLALYLAGAGVGQLWLADDDVLNSTNLHRQILFDSHSLLQSKAALAKVRLQALNPHIDYQCCAERITPANLPALLARVDVVVDCCDNLTTRQHINRACVALQKPWVSAAAVGWQGQLMVRQNAQQPCYHCLYPDDTQVSTRCQDSGVMGPLVGVMGSLQALEVIRLLLGQTSPVAATVRRFNGLTQSWHSFVLPIDPQCAVCRPYSEVKA